MDARSEIKEFLTSRRARINPEQAGLTTYGPRRVPGLRREEVAVLAGVSVPYYTRLERGDIGGVSESVLEALARAVHPQLTPACTLLLDLPAAEGLARARERRGTSGADRFEVETVGFFERVRAGYLDTAQREPGRIEVIDARAPLSEVQRRVASILGRLTAT